MEFEVVLDIIIDALLDTAKAIPLLFLAYLLMEFIEHKASEKMGKSIQKIGVAGPAFGSLLGCVPQCGFSASASNLYTAGLITEGTLLAVFLSTSDEAIPILLSSPESIKIAWKIICIKVIIGIVFGLVYDLLLKLSKVKKEPVEICDSCGCDEEKNIFLPALKHTVKITLFILIVNLVLGFALGFLGEERLGTLLLNGNYAQPFITGLLGLIPNCAVSVMITELYINGTLCLGSAIAGLSSSAGIGLAVLLKANKSKKENIRIILTLYTVSALSGFIIMLIGL